MRSLLGWLLALATPLFAAASTAKKSSRPKAKRAPATRPAKSGRSKTTRPTAKAVSKAPAPKGRAKPERPAASAHKAPEPAPAKTTPAKTPAKGNEPKPAAPVGRAILLSPQNGNYAYSVPEFRFRWLSVGGATRYEVAWSEHPDFSGAQVVASAATEAAVPEKSLQPGATYYWRVRGGNAGGWGPWSAANSFQVLEAPQPS